MTPGDAGAMADLVRTAFASLPAVLDPQPSAGRLATVDVLHHFANGGGGCVAEEPSPPEGGQGEGLGHRAGTGAETVTPALSQGAGEQTVGCVLWCERDCGLYVSRLAVRAASRGQGLAARLLAAAETEAGRRGLPRLWLSTRLVLAGNRRLFACAGFAETTLHAHPGYDRPTFVDMEKTVRA